MTRKTIGVIFPMFWEITDDVHKQYGALEPRTVHVAKLLADLGHEVLVFAPRGSKLSHKNIRTYSGDFRAWDGRNSTPYELEKNLVLSNLEKIRECDVVLEDNHFGYLKYLKSLNPESYPLLVFSYDHHPDKIESLPLNYVLHVICVSKWQLSVMREKFKNTGHVFHLAYSGLIIENYPEPDFSKKEDDLFLYLGRFSSVKAPHLILQLAEAYPDCRFVLMGDVLFANEPGYAMEIKTAAQELDNVTVIFNATWQEKIDCLNRASGLIHPGIWEEILGWDMLEGLYFGCKIYAFDRGSPREIYKNGKQGVIVPFTVSATENYQNFERLFRSFLELKVRPEECQNRVLKHFDFTKHSFPVYRRVMQV